MSLDWNIEKLDDSFCWIICTPNHPLYNQIKRNLRNSETWFLDDDKQIKCMNPFVRFMIFETLAAKCGRVTKSNITFWKQHLKKVYVPKSGLFAKSQWLEIVCEWTNDGWIYRAPSTLDLKKCIGLKTNA